MKDENNLHVIPGEYWYEGVLFMPTFPKEVIDHCRRLNTTKDDVMVATFPKCGTTWTQNILQLIYPEVCPKRRNVSVNVPFIETGPIAEGLKSGVQVVEGRPSPRLFKTHLRARYFRANIEANKLKVVYVVRNIEDALVSMYNHYKLLPMFDFRGTWDEFFELFKARKTIAGDYKTIVSEYLDMCRHPNVLLVRYEDMKRDLPAEIGRIAKFCGRHFNDESLRNMAREVSFEAVKKNPNANPIAGFFGHGGYGEFFRKGEVGDSKNYFTPEQREYVRKYLEDFPRYFELYPRVRIAGKL